jgi:two-component system nitrogen regulation response regulator NtrX
MCSTSKDIRKEIDIGNFREDLYHRLNVFEINLEPLNKRTEDIPLLIKYFSEKISKAYGISKLAIDTDNPYLLEYDWPGNVRELRNLVERIGILASDEKVEKINSIIKESLKKEVKSKFDFNEKNFSIPLKEARENFEKIYLSSQLKKFKGNISKTADFIGMERSALHRKLKSLGIKGIN